MISPALPRQTKQRMRFALQVDVHHTRRFIGPAHDRFVEYPETTICYAQHSILEFTLRPGLDNYGNPKFFYSDPRGWAFSETMLFALITHGFLVQL
jgi:hypothetical protein